VCVTESELASKRAPRGNGPANVPSGGELSISLDHPQGADGSDGSVSALPDRRARSKRSELDQGSTTRDLNLAKYLC
jgi:hypothetical protein